jgi:hypothetical protein
LAQRFDTDELRLIGQPSVVAEGVTLELCCGTRLLYSASRNGVLARFIVALQVEPRSAQALITVVVNWVETLRHSSN